MMTNDLVERLRDKVEASKIYDDEITLASIVRTIKREELLDAGCKIEGAWMSNDLVKRLREDWTPIYGGCVGTMFEAADRIEKLEAALEAVIRYAGNAGDDYLANQARKELDGEYND